MKEKVDRREKKFDKWKAQTAEQIDNMFTHQLIAIAEEEHAITNFSTLGWRMQTKRILKRYARTRTRTVDALPCFNVVSSEKKHKMEIRFGKTQNATQTNLVEFARQRKEYQKRGPKIESIEKRRKVEMRKLHAREWTGIQEAVEEAGRNTNRKRESGREGETEERRGGTSEKGERREKPVRRAS
ncbi:hypothetical protein BLNAU_16177 [Blattamonas nauphoetae]|uniref:Uncharacterized protein n=2 Tax=Blattamonas nauphoetae TaxID=2049346 RepID=A0ABQ9XD90_9EUKA|nr:hypothetical protein BLNAU_16177 [Blattamonas nauphoetae]